MLVAAGDAPVALTQERVGLARPDGGLAQDPGQVPVAVTGGPRALLAACGLLDSLSDIEGDRWGLIVSRPLLVAAGEAPVALTQERVGLARPDGGLAQDPGQVPVAVTGGPRALLAACGLLDSWGEPGPGSKVRRGREAGHVHADF